MQHSVTTRMQFSYDEAALCGSADGRPILARQLCLRSMNFGQHWRTPGVAEVDYHLDLPVRFVIHLLARELPAYVADCRAYPSTADLERALRARQWPSAETIVFDPHLLSLALGSFGHPLLLEWLGDGEPDAAPGFVINTIVSLTRCEQVVRCTGRARQAGQAVLYQDV